MSLALVTGLRTTDGGTVMVRLRANGASPAVELPVSRRQTRELRDRLVRDPMRGYRSVRGDELARDRRGERVVLAHRRGARMVRTRVEVQEQTEVGDALVRGLVRAQLGLALRLAAVVMCVVRRNSVAERRLFPALAATSRVRHPAELAGARRRVYPLLYGVGRLYVRLAEQGEREFVRVVDDGTVTGPCRR